jgi:hypothetical protein
MSALPVAVTVIEGRVPPPETTGVVHELSSVWSVATVEVSRVHVLPAVSVTDFAVALPALQMPTCTISRSPVLTTWGGVRANEPPKVRPDVCCTKASAPAALGVTALLCADAGPVPIAFVAVTVNVYALPFASPPTLADVGTGLPVTVTTGWACPDRYGVTVYEVIAEPPSSGAVHDTCAEESPGVAVTVVGADGAVRVRESLTIAATDGTPLPFTTKTM